MLPTVCVSEVIEYCCKAFPTCCMLMMQGVKEHVKDDPNSINSNLHHGRPDDNACQKMFRLTDPAILCEYDMTRFTSTNMGRAGVGLFFRSHKCNQICKQLGLTRPQPSSLTFIQEDA